MLLNIKRMANTEMKAMVASGYGGPEVFELKNVVKPAPKPNEILVKVSTASVTTADTMMRTGKPYFGRLFLGLTKPQKAIPGTGFAGVVESIGENVGQFKVGDRVFGETLFNFSSAAEYLVVEEGGVVLKMPDTMAFEEASNYCDGHLTSYNFLRNIYEVKPNQRVLVNGASGSLGTSAIQLAKYFGAHVTAVCSHKNAGLVKSLGADHVIDYQEDDFTAMNHAFDVVYDTIGRSSFQACKDILANDGVYMSPVLQMPLLGQMIWTSIFGKKKAKFEATGANAPSKLKALLEEVLEIFKQGKLKMVIDRQYPLAKLPEAHRYIDSGRKKGNAVLRVS